jgi:hypothetical protein
MKIRKGAIRWGMIVLLIAIPLAFSWYQSYKKDHFSCDARIMVFGETVDHEAIIHFTFDGDTGSYAALGQIGERGKSEIETANKFTFKYWRDGSNLIMISNHNRVVENVFNQYFPQTPDFFVYQERGIDLHVVRENSSNYLFSYAGTPLFYCKLTHLK